MIVGVVRVELAPATNVNWCEHSKSQTLVYEHLPEIIIQKPRGVKVVFCSAERRLSDFEPQWQWMNHHAHAL